MLRNFGQRPAHFALRATGFFAISPTCGIVEPENFLEVYVQFRPPLVGVHEGELIAAYNNNDERMYCKLYGVGLEVCKKHFPFFLMISYFKNKKK